MTRIAPHIAPSVRQVRVAIHDSANGNGSLTRRPRFSDVRMGGYGPRRPSFAPLDGRHVAADQLAPLRVRERVIRQAQRPPCLAGTSSRRNAPPRGFGAEHA